jgi:hypothetical protein
VDDGERTMGGLPGRLTGDDQGVARVARAEQVNVRAGLDVGKENYFAEVLDDGGERIFGRGVASDEAALEALVDRAAKYGTVGLVIDQPGSIAQLTLAVAARRRLPVAYVPGLVMRRAADLCPGEAQTAMFLAAFAFLRDPASRAFGDRERTEGKRRNAALICLARRRCDVILAMLTTRQPYRDAPRTQHGELSDAA